MATGPNENTAGAACGPPPQRAFRIEKDVATRAQMARELMKEIDSKAQLYRRRTGGQVLAVVVDVDPEQGLRGKLYDTHVSATGLLQ